MVSLSPLAPVVTTYGGERYRLLSCIGRGATGGVYRAQSAADGGPVGCDVCIKRLAGSLSPEHERAMREEARLLARVRHANVVSLLAMGHEEGGAPFLVLELIDGADLRALTRALGRATSHDEPTATHAGWLPDRVAVHVACAVLRALAAVQRAIPGLVHRDVTPHNILVSREGEVKLTDFGIALALDRARWTRPSVVKGKLGYMAPEQIRGEPLDHRCDLFAVGVVLFELLARRRPWFAADANGSDFDELRAIEQGEIASIVECRPRLDRVLGGVVDRLLAHDREDRFDSPDAALRALAPFGAGDLGSLRLASIVETAFPRHLGSMAVPSAPRSMPGTASLSGADPARASSPPSPPSPEAAISECDPAAHGPSSRRADPAIDDGDLTVIEGRSRRLEREIAERDR